MFDANLNTFCRWEERLSLNELTAPKMNFKIYCLLSVVLIRSVLINIFRVQIDCNCNNVG